MSLTRMRQKTMLCRNLSKNIVVAENVEPARTMFERMMGLMFRPALEDGKGMHISRCAAVHTCFMRFEMDAVFLDRNLRVLRVIHQMRPWHFSPWVWGADSVLELPGGSAAGVLSAGDTVSFS